MNKTRFTQTDLTKLEYQTKARIMAELMAQGTIFAPSPERIYELNALLKLSK